MKVSTEVLLSGFALTLVALIFNLPILALLAMGLYPIHFICRAIEDKK